MGQMAKRRVLSLWMIVVSDVFELPDYIHTDKRPHDVEDQG